MQTLNVKFTTGDDPSDLFRRPVYFQNELFFLTGRSKRPGIFYGVKYWKVNTNFFTKFKPYASGFFREGVFDATHKRIDASSESRTFL